MVIVGTATVGAGAGAGAERCALAHLGREKDSERRRLRSGTGRSRESKPVGASTHNTIGPNGRIPKCRGADAEKTRQGIGQRCRSHSIHTRHQCQMVLDRRCTTCHLPTPTPLHLEFSHCMPSLSGCCSQDSSSRRTSVPFFPHLTERGLLADGDAAFFLVLCKIRTDRISQSVSSSALNFLASVSSGCLLCRVTVESLVCRSSFYFQLLPSLLPPKHSYLLKLSSLDTSAIKSVGPIAPSYPAITYFRTRGQYPLAHSPVTTCWVAPTSKSCAILQVESVSVIATISTTISAPPSSRVQYKSRTDPRSLQIRF